MSSAVDADDGRMAKRLRPAVLGGITGPALLPVEEQRGTRDPRPQQLDVAARHVVRRPHPYVVVELPAVRGVLVLVDALRGEMPRLLYGQMRVLLLHAPESVLDRRVPPRHAAGERSLLPYPLVHPLRDRLLAPLCQHARRRSDPLDRDQLRDRLRI